MKDHSLLKVVCFGEILFDVFPDEERIGGAPLNVASRLSSLGIHTEMISKIGKDEKGEQVLAYLNENKIHASNIKMDAKHPTGLVKVSLSSRGSATYEFTYPSAWDHIELTDGIKESVKNADAFIYGSLACRDAVTRKTLFELLKIAKYKIFDFNLRPPHYTYDNLVELIQFADFIKFNDDELFEFSEAIGSKYNSMEQNIRFISERYPNTTICVTKGRHGAILLAEDTFYYNSGYKINVKDTVGAGDSFLASLIGKLLLGEDYQNSLDYACAIGALVAGESGANPHLDENRILEFMCLE